MRLLVIEDNGRLAGLVAEGLAARGFVCDVVASLAEAEAALAVASFDAVVLDLGLPDGDGRQWLAEQRRKHLLFPVLMLTARGALDDKVAGLDAGADDYLVKPVAIEELAARLRALLRRPGERGRSPLECGPLKLDLATRRTTCESAEIDLARREMALLELLMRRQGTVVERRSIEDALYSFNDPVTPNAIEAVVSRLRRKLEDAGYSGHLHTVRGLGYLLAP